MYKQVIFFSVVSLLIGANAQLCIAASSSQPPQENSLNRPFIPIESIETILKNYEQRIQTLEAENRELAQTVEKQEHALNEMNTGVKDHIDAQEKNKEYETEIAMLVEMIDESIEKADTDAQLLEEQQSQIKNLQQQLPELTKTILYCAVEVTNPQAENYQKKQSMTRALKTAALQTKTERNGLLESLFTQLIDYVQDPTHKNEIEGGIARAADIRNSANL